MAFCLLLCPQRIAGRMTATAVADLVHKIRTPVPECASGGIVVPWNGMMKEAIPERHQGADVKRKPEFSAGYGAVSSRLGHQPPIQRHHVLVTHPTKRGVGKSRVQMVALARDAFAHCSLKCTVRPKTNTGLRVGG